MNDQTKEIKRALFFLSHSLTIMLGTNWNERSDRVCAIEEKEVFFLERKSASISQSQSVLVVTVVFCCQTRACDPCFKLNDRQQRKRREKSNTHLFHTLLSTKNSNTIYKRTYNIRQLCLQLFLALLASSKCHCKTLGSRDQATQ